MVVDVLDGWCWVLLSLASRVESGGLAWSEPALIYQ